MKIDPKELYQLIYNNLDDFELANKDDRWYRFYSLIDNNEIDSKIINITQSKVVKYPSFACFILNSLYKRFDKEFIGLEDLDVIFTSAVAANFRNLKMQEPITIKGYYKYKTLFEIIKNNGGLDFKKGVEYEEKDDKNYQENNNR